jgi:prophage antirepressor-like protein
MSVQIFQFETQAIRTQTDESGSPWFNANDVCGALGYSNPHKAVSDHVDPDDLTKRDAIDSLGRTQSSNHLNESGVYSLVFGSTLQDAKRFKRWVTSEVLPSIRKTGAYIQPSTSGQPTPEVATIQFAEALCRMLRLEGSAALGMARKATALAAPHLISLVPDYAIDAPRNEDGTLIGGGSAEPTEALTDLLKRMGSNLSAKQANKILESLGLLERMQRRSASGLEYRGFWHITAKGLKYGKNVSSSQNQSETQPHWYRSCGVAIVRMLDVCDI